MIDNIVVNNIENIKEIDKLSDSNIDRSLSSFTNTHSDLSSIYLLGTPIDRVELDFYLNLEDSNNSELELLTVNSDIELDKAVFEKDNLSLISSNDIIFTTYSSINYTNSILGDREDNLIKGKIEHDNILGWGGNDTIFGHFGNDLIRGHNGDDILYGNEGDDRLVGNNGNDILDGGAGNNVLIDNSGSNIFVLSDVGFSRIVYFDLSQDTIELSNGISYDDLRFTGLVNTKISYEGNLIGFIKGVGSSEISANNFSKIF